MCAMCGSREFRKRMIASENINFRHFIDRHLCHSTVYKRRNQILCQRKKLKISNSEKKTMYGKQKCKLNGSLNGTQSIYVHSLAENRVRKTF